MRARQMRSLALLLAIFVCGPTSPPPRQEVTPELEALERNLPFAHLLGRDAKAELVALVRRLSFDPPPGRNAKAELEALARKLPFFQTHMFVYDSDHHQMPNEVYAAYQKVMRPLFRRAYPASSLVPLLKHPNPRVRTLAAAGLYAYEDPRLLHDLVPLLTDDAETFPEVSAPSNFSIGAGWYKMPPKERQTVGEVARRFLDIYLTTAGYQAGIAPEDGRRGWQEYWAARKDRTHCASWFAIRLIRICRGSSSPPEDRLEAVRSLRKEIDRLPEVDRALTLLWLWEQWGGDVLVSENELFQFCQKLGPDRLVAILRKKPINTDPDLWTNGYERFRQSLYVIIIPHAKELLRKTDAEVLVEGGWYIAGVDLQPERAAALLDKCWTIALLDGVGGPRMMLNLERWRRLPGEGTALTVKRFYEEKGYERPYSFEDRAWFLSKMGKTWKPRDRELLVALVRDERFATLDWHSLDAMARLVNEVEKRIVVDPAELEKTRQILGLNEEFRPPELMSFEQYPKETPEIIRRKEVWRTLIRKAVLNP